MCGPADFLKIYEPNKVYSKQELEQINELLKTMWNDMIKSIEDNNIEKASSYFVELNQDAMKTTFEALKPDQRREFVNELKSGQIAMERIQGSEAVYQVIKTQKGERYSSQLSFQKNIYGAWKIVSF